MTKDKPVILLVDDDPSLIRLLELRLEAQGYDVKTANDGIQALQKLETGDIDLVLSDLRMDKMGGMELFEEVQKRYPGLPVIIITAQGSIPDAVAAAQSGVFGFLTKPIEKDELFRQIELALFQASHKPQGEANQEWRSDIFSRSQTMERLLVTSKRVADSDVSVLITGASGSGKELLANAIHRASIRNGHPFIAINCGALPEPLLESELFGHIKGAFTGAMSDNLGLFRAADGGTLFLDEIGDMPKSLQVKLLRVLQEKQVRPVGSTKNYNIDVRIISATHKNLSEEMKKERFREDLYYRLNVVNLKLPSLSERREDIPLLANHFLRKSTRGMGGKVTGFSPDAMQLLASATWPGNVRQLENVVQQTIALAHTKVVPVSLVQDALDNETGYMPSLTDARNQFEREYLMKVLRLTGGNVSQASRLAQRNRTDFYKLMQKHELKAEQFKSLEVH